MPQVEPLEERCLLATAVLTATLTSTQETPPTLSSALGSATVTLDTVTGSTTISATVQGFNLANITGFQLREAPLGQVGPVLAELLPPNTAVNFTPGPNNTLNYVNSGIGVPVSQIRQALNDGLYLNLNTTGYPNGEIRGQIVEPHIFAASVDAGVPSVVNVYDSKGALLSSFQAFSGFFGGVRVAVADFNGDGVKDIVVGAGPGAGPHVKVIDGTKINLVSPQGAILDSDLLASFYAFGATWPGGVYVGAGDVNGDAIPDLVVGAGPGAGPHVKVIDGTKLTQTGPFGVISDTALLASFYAYGPTWPGGVRVAIGDVNGDGFGDVITGAGPGAGPHVKAVNGLNLRVVESTGQISDVALLYSFYAFDSTFSGGVYVASNFVNNDSFADIVTGEGPGGTPTVTIFSGRNGAALTSFQAFTSTFTGGVRVATMDADNNNLADIVTGSGPGLDSRVTIFEGITLQVLDNFIAFGSSSNGVYVGGQ